MKRMAIFLVLALLCSGCGGQQEETIYRVVTGIDVEYHQQDSTLIRTYRKSGNIESILTYIRILKPYGPVNPDGQYDTNCTITLHYSSGADTVYIQQGCQYLQKDGGDWKVVDTSRASLLYPLLLLLPSDSES